MVRSAKAAINIILTKFNKQAIYKPIKILKTRNEN
jgi:hypothetical protein